MLVFSVTSVLDGAMIFLGLGLVALGLGYLFALTVLPVRLPWQWHVAGVGSLLVGVGLAYAYDWIFGFD